MIDQEGINSLNTGAEAITYQGTEGPKSPEQEQAMALGIPEGLTLEEAVRTFELSNDRPPKDIQEVIEFFKTRTLSEGPPLPNDPTEPVNPFGPKPIGPPLPNRQMAAFGGIMGLDQRKQYGLGSKFKRILNKVTRPVTKIAQKLVPKELAGPLRTIAPFLPPGYREAAYLAGTAKQKGRFNFGDLAFAAAPYARFEGTAAGEGILGSRTKFKEFGTAKPGDFGIRDLITGGETGGAYEDIGGEGLLGKIKLGETDLGQMSDEFIFGKPAQTREVVGRQEYDIEGLPKARSMAEREAYIKNLSPSEQLKLENFAEKYEKLNLQNYGDITNASDKKFIDNILYRPDVTKTAFDSATPGILGMGGEMSVLGGAGGGPGIMKSKAGKTLFGDGEGGVSKLKLGSWAIGIVSGIQAGKYKDEMEAAEAAEAAALAADSEASEATLQAARDWAISTFGNMSVYADGGRIGFASGTPDPGMMQGLGALKGQQKQNPNTKTIDMMPDIQILTGSENTIDAQQVFPNDIAIAIGDGTFVFNGLKFNSEEDLMEYMSKVMPFKADGGRINKNMGGEMDMGGISSLQTQASDVTPPGMELDLRGGGFIPIGTAEKADDVPARVSKNEFVFTADAVKAAGGGSVNEGAKKMYDTMKRLESQVG